MGFLMGYLLCYRLDLENARRAILKSRAEKNVIRVAARKEAGQAALLALNNEHKTAVEDTNTNLGGKIEKKKITREDHFLDSIDEAAPLRNYVVSHKVNKIKRYDDEELKYLVSIGKVWL